MRRILLVDDEPDILTIAGHALQALGGFEVALCENGSVAVAQAPLFLPNLIVSDVMMPGMNGIETYNALRSLQVLQHTPIVFMTARVQNDELEEYKQTGAVAVIKKPFNPMTLHDELGAIWARYAVPAARA